MSPDIEKGRNGSSSPAARHTPGIDSGFGKKFAARRHGMSRALIKMHKAPAATTRRLAYILQTCQVVNNIHYFVNINLNIHFDSVTISPLLKLIRR